MFKSVSLFSAVEPHLRLMRPQLLRKAASPAGCEHEIALELPLPLNCALVPLNRLIFHRDRVIRGDLTRYHLHIVPC